MSTSIGRQTHSSCICTRKASWDEGPGECTQLCLGQPELPGIGIGGHAIWEFNERQESPCSSKSFGCHEEGLGTSLSMDCKYGLYMMDCKYGL
jgi:hypothetical protein